MNPHPIIVLHRTAGAPFRAYVVELLRQEGYLCFDALSLDAEAAEDLPAALDGRALAIVTAETVQREECEALAAFAREGGRLMLIAPPHDLAAAVGLTFASPPDHRYGVAPPAYVRITPHAWSPQHEGLTVQVQAPVALRRVEGARALATYAANREELSPFGAVVQAPCGQGTAGVWWFDLGRALVLARQGNPRNASTAETAHADADIVKPGTLFLNHLDPTLRHIPQADVLADLFVGMVRGLTDDVLPLPRMWHFPDDAPALTLLDGDSDLYDWDVYARLVEPALEAGIPYTLNLMPRHLADLNRAAADAYAQRGCDFQLHYKFPGWQPTVADLMRCVSEQQVQFENAFGRRSTCSRAHSVLWPGWTEPAEIYARHGARMETNFMPFRGCQYGYAGSARPGRYMTPDGRVVALAQQPTVFMDDPMASDKSGLPVRSPEEAHDIVARFYEASVARYHGALCTCLHPVVGAARETQRRVQEAMREAIVEHTRRHNLPALTQGGWAAFRDARRALDLRYEKGGWRVIGPEPVAGLTLHTPADTGVLRQGRRWKAEPVVSVNSE